MRFLDFLIYLNNRQYFLFITTFYIFFCMYHLEMDLYKLIRSELSIPVDGLSSYLFTLVFPSTIYFQPRN